ncbi:hypothetical protein CDCA_CDCA09G2637 [Cyanidium caldarium]|uniref:Cytochrome b5 heme-binding domain-containing protein n=1 Tax=Cyanidium caldarium TaxID=2771 RepID=A0AAV9IWA0_CYACA|nr:hypothetical protein CDCA_CDCA09G2637 [Cyanidium caldarium]
MGPQNGSNHVDEAYSKRAPVKAGHSGEQPQWSGQAAPCLNRRFVWVLIGAAVALGWGHWLRGLVWSRALLTVSISLEGAAWALDWASWITRRFRRRPRVTLSYRGRLRWEEVAAHNTAGSAWVAAHGKVYDVTDFVDRHPGGRELILLAAGRDATYLIESYHPFTEAPWRVLVKHEIGELASNEHPPYAGDRSGFWRDVRRAVQAHLRQHGIRWRSPWPALQRMLPVYALQALAFYGAFGLPAAAALSTSPVFSLAVIRTAAATLSFGVLQALPLVGWMHDASHASIGINEWWWFIVGRLSLDWFAGASMLSWRYQHVVGHHVHTNVAGSDPDLPATVAGDVRRVAPSQLWARRYRYQHYYVPLLYGVLGMKSRLQDVLEIFLWQTNGPVRVNPISWQDSLRQVASKLGWCWWRIAWPLSAAWAPAQRGGAFWWLFVAAELTTGYYLALNFQVSHVSGPCEFYQRQQIDERPDPTSSTTSSSGENCAAAAAHTPLAGDIADEWAVAQVKSSLDYAHRSRLQTFLSGALNYQTAHHLFPSVSQYVYPHITPVIMRVCGQHRLKYHVLPSFGAALRLHLKHLQALGARGVPAELRLE